MHDEAHGPHSHERTSPADDAGDAGAGKTAPGGRRALRPRCETTQNFRVTTHQNGARGKARSVREDVDMPSPQQMSREYRKVVAASVFGTIIEWYDFLIYGTAAALVFNKLFFPGYDPVVGTLAAFSTYAVGFVARPIGGAIIGHYGDRLGRKTMLVATMIAMGLGTFLIGCLPTYSQIGVWAPILLVCLRFIQGIGLGG